MANYKDTIKKLAKVSTTGGCSNFGCMAQVPC